MRTESHPVGKLVRLRSFADAIGQRAMETAASLNMVLVDQELSSRCLAEIRSKVVSIAAKEIAPIISPFSSRHTGWSAAIDAVGGALGVCYLGDYALERDAAFDLTAARDIVCRVASDAGLSSATTARFVEDLAAFYLSEASGSPYGSCDRDLASWYSIKSRDVLFAQVLALSSIGVQTGREDMSALAHAGAALEVLDDITDVVEDRGRRTSNPFIATTSSMNRSDLYQSIEAMCMEKIMVMVESPRISPGVRSYSVAVSRRVMDGISAAQGG